MPISSSRTDLNLIQKNGLDLRNKFRYTEPWNLYVNENRMFAKAFGDKLTRNEIDRLRNTLNFFKGSSRHLVLILCCLLLFSCKSADWKRAQQQNTVTGYSTFVKKFPEDKLSVKAREKIRLLEWESARESNSFQGYKKFIERYPDSDLVSVAKRAMDSIPWNKAQKKSTIKGYRFFIRNNPENRFLKAAENTLLTLTWEKTKGKNTLKGYKKFLDENIGSKYTQEAINLLDKAPREKDERRFFEDAKRTNTLHGYRTFLEIYPKSVYGGQVSTLLIPLLPEDLARKVRLLTDKNPLKRGIGVLNLAETKKKDLLSIITFLINMLDDGTRINPDDLQWQRSSTIGIEVKKILISIGEKAVPTLVNALFLGGHINSKYSTEIKLKLVDTLKAIGGEEASDALIETLIQKKSHYKVELRALKALFLKFNDPRTEKLATEIATRYLQDPDKNIRLYTVRRLQEIKHSSTVKPLLESLRSKNNSTVKIEVIKTLGLIGDKSATETLYTLLQTEQSVRIIGYLIENLELLHDHRAVPTILSIAKTNRDIYTRRKAVKALLVLYDPVKNFELRTELSTLQNNMDEYIRENVRRLLGK